MVICNNVEGTAVQVGLKFAKGPGDSQAFLFGNGVVGFRFC